MKNSTIKKVTLTADFQRMAADIGRTNRVLERSIDNGAAYTLVITRESKIHFGMLALERFVDLASGTGAGMLYSDYFDMLDGKHSAHPVIDYQAGSLRDDFEFGPVLFFNSHALMRSTGAIRETLMYAGLYQLRLKISQEGMPLRIPEYLYAVEPIDTRVSGKKMFDKGHKSSNEEE